MQLKKALTQLNGLQFMIENLDLKSAMGKRFLVETPWFVSKEAIEAEVNITVIFEPVLPSKAIGMSH